MRPYIILCQGPNSVTEENLKMKGIGGAIIREGNFTRGLFSGGEAIFRGTIFRAPAIFNISYNLQFSLSKSENAYIIHENNFIISIIHK